MIDGGDGRLPARGDGVGAGQGGATKKSLGWGGGLG